MKLTKLFMRHLLLLVIVALGATGCAKDDADGSNGEYGYVQFRLFKSGSYADNVSTRAETRAGTGILDLLYDAAKIQLTLRPVGGSGSNIVQTVPLEAQNKQLAEYGMQSAKFLLVEGEYELVEYRLFDKIDNAIPSFLGIPDEKTIITIVPGGLTLQDVVVNTRERGGVRFRLTKANVEEITPVTTRAGETAIKEAFHTIVAFDVTVYNDYLNEELTFEKLDVRHEYFRPEETPDYYTSEAVCDSLFTGLRGGEWSVTKARVYYDDISYTMYDDLTVVAENSFTVYDNGISEASIPVTLNVDAADIQDAIALKEIWEALDGPNWRTKWDFERDIDLWTAQPGVSVLSSGRVAALDLSDVGARGAMPAAISKLTELRQLYLGTHNWLPASANLDPSLAAAARRKHTLYDESKLPDMAKSFERTFIYDGEPLHGFSKELQQSFVLNGDLDKVGEPSLRALSTGSTENYSNFVTSLPDEITQLKKLGSIYIAYSTMESLPADMSAMEGLTDVEIFNCPKITQFPDGITTLPNLNTIIISTNANLPEQEMYDGLVALASGAAAEKLQTLQIAGQPIDKIPDLTGLTGLAQIDIQNCGVTEFEAAFSEDQVLGSVNASFNELTDLPRNSAGHFMGLEGEIEKVNFSYNKFTKFPDIFEADSKWKIINVDFSFNNITSVENGYDEGNTYKGILVEILALSYNNFAKFPREILHKGSTINYLQLQGNQISIGKRQSPLDETSEDEDWFDLREAPKVANLTAIDLSYNKLDRLPSSFNGQNLSFTGGVDLSYNRFSSVPMGNVFNLARLTTFVFRGQRDESGNRIMRSWPIGAYAHTSLRAMYLGSNDIRAVDDRVSWLWSALEIADNPNISITIDADTCYQISMGMMFAYDPWQDIRGCPILRLDK